MPIFKPCPPEVHAMLEDLMHRYEDHEDLITTKARIDLVFAYADRDEAGAKLNNALTHGGQAALGIARSIGPKDRALGRGDAEISLDGDWWETATEDKRLALMDHELHHIAIKHDRLGNPKLDDSERPLIRMRKHDFQFGWFAVIAARHGNASPERIQAKQMMDEAGQYFWGDLMDLPKTQSQEAVGDFVNSMRASIREMGDGSVTISSGNHSTTISAQGIKHFSKKEAE